MSPLPQMRVCGCTRVMYQYPLCFVGGGGHGGAHLEEISALLLEYTLSWNDVLVSAEESIPQSLLYEKL